MRMSRTDVPRSMTRPDSLSRARSEGERGIALILVLLVVVLLYILVAEVVTRSSFDEMTSQNQSHEAGIRTAMRLALVKAIEELSSDSDSSGGEGGAGAGAGAGGLGALGGAGQGGGGAGGEEEGGEEAVGDSTRDAWFRSKSIYDDNKISVYAWIEDENRKFNVHNLISPDEDYAELSRQRLMRLLDKIWEDTEEDLSGSEAEAWANDIRDWLRGSTRNDDRPEPPLKRRETDGDAESRFSETTRIEALSLGELRMIPRIPEAVFADRIVGEEILLGLESVLTVYTSLAVDPGDGDEEGGGDEGGNANGGNAGGGGGEQGGGAGANPQAPGGGPTVLEPGPRININTAPRVVLRALEDESVVPDTVLEAIIRYRNEVDEEAQEAADGENEERDTDELLQDDLSTKYKYFPSLDKLSDIREYENLPDSNEKKRFEDMLTTKSNVFTIHLAAVYKRDEAGRSYSVTRAKTVVARIADGEEATVQELIPLHRISTLRIQVVDYPEEEQEQRDRERYEMMDDFMREESQWNPFVRAFFDPEERERER